MNPLKARHQLQEGWWTPNQTGRGAEEMEKEEGAAMKWSFWTEWVQIPHRSPLQASLSPVSQAKAYIRQCPLSVPRTREHRHDHNPTVRTWWWVTSSSMASLGEQFLSFLPPLPLNLKLYMHSLPCYNPLRLVSPHISKGDKDEKDEVYAGVQTSLCIPSGGWHWVTSHCPHMGIRMKYKEWYLKWSCCETNSFVYAVIRFNSDF